MGFNKCTGVNLVLERLNIFSTTADNLSNTTWHVNTRTNNYSLNKESEENLNVRVG